MTFEPTRLDPDGNLPMVRSIVPGEHPGSLSPGQLAVNAADGLAFVGNGNGTPVTCPRASGFNRIVSLSQSEFDAITPNPTTLYVVVPDPS
jgi:hypothetical protein